MIDFKRDLTKYTKYAFATAEIADNVAYQSFSFLVFTFYFTSVKLPIPWISTGFIIWSIWNAFNDPILGQLSDRTKSKLGRRIPWLMGIPIPLALIMILLFTPPMTSSDAIKFGYFLIMLFLFDMTYTGFNLNYNSMFSEMFISADERAKVGQIRLIFVIISLIFAFIMPTLIIQDVTNEFSYDYTQTQFMINGILIAVIILTASFIVVRWGVRNTTLFNNDAEQGLSFKEALKQTLKNKAFRWFLIPGLGTWTVLGILPTLIPLWATYVLGITEENSIKTGILLLTGFLMAGFSMPLWTKIRQKKGARASGLWGIGTWCVTIMSFLFAYDFISGFISMLLIGLGLGGSLYFYDQCLAEIIDQDELVRGVRRPGIHYGIMNFIIRFSGVINFLMIGIVFTGSDWQSYSPNPTIDTLKGLQFLISWYPLIVLIISFIGLYFYPIKGKLLEENRAKLTALHQEKRNIIYSNEKK